MRRLIAYAVTITLGLTVLNDCACNYGPSDGSWRSYPCGDPVTVCEATGEATSDDRSWSFESECVGARCGVQAAVGQVYIGESYHPADRALYIAAGGVAVLPFTTPRAPDGARMSVNVRCTEGAQLWFDGDGFDLTPQVLQLAASSPWRRFERRLRTPSRFVPGSDGVGVQTMFAPRFRVTGRGECAIDRLRYTVSRLVCVAYRTYQPTCVERTTPLRDTKDAMVDGLSSQSDADEPDVRHGDVSMPGIDAGRETIGDAGDDGDRADADDARDSGMDATVTVD